MIMQIEACRHSVFARVGRFSIYAHGPSIPSGWTPDHNMPGESVFALGPVTVYMVNKARLPFGVSD